jgi:UDP-4-amino-4-deoxy-L-arabinose-oxoglutarate aminotransferase
VATLEDAMAERLGARHAIAVVSPMAAFHLGYRAAGVSLGATILATSFADPTVVRAGSRTATASPSSTSTSGDIFRPTRCGRRSRSAAIHRLIVASHHAGHACETAALGELAPGALVIEDAVDALGAAAADGRPIGSPAMRR